MNEWTIYKCQTCDKKWHSNEGEKEQCPICRGEINEYYEKIK